jgi:poly(3-hydroxyalkanoate) synthetase
MISKHETSEPELRPGDPPEGPPRATSVLEASFVWPLAAATWAGQANLQLFRDFMSLASGRPSATGGSSFPWTTPNKIALELPTMRLRDFSTGAEGSATLICAPYALHAATVADFAPGHSLVGTLSHGGLSRLFVTDWRSATPEMRYLTIDNYLADLNVAVDELGLPVNLVGLCQGGWLALVYAARFPEKVRRLVLVGAPVDIAAAKSPLSRLVAELPLGMFEELVRVGEGIVHGDRMLEFWPISAGEAEKALQNPPALDPARRQELNDRFRRWNAETIDLPGTFYLQVVKCLFKENQIAEGRFVALGQSIDLKQVRVPIFMLAAGNDEVVPADQLFATARLVGTSAEHQEKMVEPCGHLGLFLGEAVLEGAWRKIAHWLSL